MWLSAIDHTDIRGSKPHIVASLSPEPASDSARALGNA